MRDNKKDEGDVTFEKLILDCLFMAVALLSSLLEFAQDYGEKLGKAMCNEIIQNNRDTKKALLEHKCRLITAF